MLNGIPSYRLFFVRTFGVVCYLILHSIYFNGHEKPLLPRYLPTQFEENVTMEHLSTCPFYFALPANDDILVANKDMATDTVADYP